MDGEHAFSASLTLVMVNVAFPHNERDAKAMETALSVLRGMAEKGNEYIQARLTLLMNLRATIGRRSPRTGPQRAVHTTVPEIPTDTAQPMSTPSVAPVAPMPLEDASLQLTSNFYPFQDVSLEFQIDNDDPTFWEEIYGNIDIDMETGWIENALRNDMHQNQWNV